MGSLDYYYNSTIDLHRTFVRSAEKVQISAKHSDHMKCYISISNFGHPQD